jgi:hypothetical protein
MVGWFDSLEHHTILSLLFNVFHLLKSINILKDIVQVTHGLALGEGGDFYHKCSCGEPNFD